MDQITKENFREEIKIRCPECLKLYAVKTDQITESRPRFQCVGCEKQFWITYPEVLSMGEEILGYPLDWLETNEPSDQSEPMAHSKPEPEPVFTNANPRVFACPKCGHGYASGESECVKCGVVFLRMKESPRPAVNDISASIEVRELWDEVLNDYENFEKHQNFINAALADKSLTYAAQHYSRILEVCPQDELAQKAQKEVSSLAFARFESQIVKDGSSKTNFFGDIDISFRRFRFTTLILFMCAMVIAMGFILPHQRNLVGVGTAVMFFILALRFYFRVI